MNKPIKQARRKVRTRAEILRAWRADRETFEGFGWRAIASMLLGRRCRIINPGEFQRGIHEITDCVLFSDPPLKLFELMYRGNPQNTGWFTRDELEVLP